MTEKTKIREGLLSFSPANLPGNQHIDLALMILIIGKAFTNLRLGEIGQALGGANRIHRFAILQQAHHIMHRDASASTTGWPLRIPGRVTM
jgi:hypothetical protein